MKQPKVTGTVRATLQKAALLKAQLPTYRQLAHETGLTELYVRQLMSTMIRQARHKCDDSRGTS